MSEFPTIADLALADEDTVLRLWEGLGYYSRARNLHAAARYVHGELGGKFPSTYNEILKLKGVGPYTAAAIASICFNEPTPVVDGNVYRFASRYFGIDEDISSTRARRVFENILIEEISPERPGDFNQGMMEFGATTCAPKPNCDLCPFSKRCYAFSMEKQRELPIKTKKTKVRNRQLNYIAFQTDTNTFMKKREGKDVWEGLYDFHLIEGKVSDEDILQQVTQILGEVEFTVLSIAGPIQHILSHQRLSVFFYRIHTSPAAQSVLLQNTALEVFSIEEVVNLPKPKVIVNFLKEADLI